MSKVYFTGSLGPEHILNGMVWEKLENGWYLSPDLPEETVQAYLTCSCFRAVVLPASEKPQPTKKPAAKKTTAKPKGGE